MTNEVTGGQAVEIRRTFPVTPRRVYEAWTDPEEAKLWSGPGEVDLAEIEGEVKAGAKYRLHFRMPSGEVWVAGGEYLEVTPPSKLVYTWAWENDPQWEGASSIVTVEFLPIAEGTELRLTHQRFPNEITRGNHANGWSGALAKLEKLLATWS